jgi:transposase
MCVTDGENTCARMHTNNARAERLNGAVQELKTIGRGYNNTANFKPAILLFHGNLDLFPHNSQ